MKYSIIIPVYNAEKTLRRCLDSLLPQMNRSIEILLINDGSFDSSGDICKEYLQKNDSLKYFEQENAGVSAARNKGLDNATGEYILFIDSDDYVDPKYLKTIEECLKNELPELLIFSAEFIHSNRKNTMLQYDDMCCSGKDTFKRIDHLRKTQKMHTLWNKVFLKRIIAENSIRFNTNLDIGEDSVFVFHYSLFVNRLVTKKEVLYYVDESSQSSLSRKKRNYLSEQLIMTSKCLEDIITQVPLNKQQERLYRKRLSRGFYRDAYSCFLEVSKWTCDKHEQNKEIDRICSDFRKNRITPIGLEAIILSLPVLWNLIPIIRSVLFFKTKRVI